MIPDPLLRKIVQTVVINPLRDAIEALAGLSEGELRSRAAIRLGADLVAGMALDDVCDYLIADPDHDR